VHEIKNKEGGEGGEGGRGEGKGALRTTEVRFFDIARDSHLPRSIVINLKVVNFALILSYAFFIEIATTSVQ
jgi:hypothetical protein